MFTGPYPGAPSPRARGRGLLPWGLCDTRGVSEPVVAILVAAGLGLRYGGATPKPALRITNRALIEMSIDAMCAGGCTAAVVVTNPATAAQVTRRLRGAPIPVYTTSGGSTRQESVRRGLRFVADHPDLSGAGIVLIHDAVRPMTPARVVADVISAVRGGAAAVAPALPVSDTIRELSDDGSSRPTDRTRLRAVQTPQGFPLRVIADAHERMAAQGLEFTDDLSCAEAAGHRVELVEGSRLGMKVTEPADLTVAKALWRMRGELGHHSAGGLAGRG